MQIKGHTVFGTALLVIDDVINGSRSLTIIEVGIGYSVNMILMLSLVRR